MSASSALGFDWGAMGLSLLALYLIGNQNRAGFLCFMSANLCWLAVGWLVGSTAIVLGNLIFFAANLRGFLRWGSTPEAAPSPRGPLICARTGGGSKSVGAVD